MSRPARAVDDLEVLLGGELVRGRPKDPRIQLGPPIPQQGLNRLVQGLAASGKRSWAFFAISRMTSSLTAEGTRSSMAEGAGGTFNSISALSTSRGISSGNGSRPASSSYITTPRE